MSEEKNIKRKDGFTVLPETLHEKKNFNVRYDYGDIDGLKNSIVQNGVKKPFEVRPMKDDKEKFIVVDGHRRLAAINKALEEGEEVGRVPVVKVDKHSSEEDDIFDLIIQNDGKTLTLLEQGEVFKRLKDKHYEPKEIAERIGKSYGHVINGLTLASAPKVVKEYIQKDRIASTTVLEVLRKVDDAEEQKKMVENAVMDKDDKISSDKKEKSEGKKSGPSQKSSGGKKNKKVTKKEVLGDKGKKDDKGVLKKIAEVEKKVKGVEYDHTKTDVLKKLHKAMKDGKSADEIAKIFEKDDKRTKVGTSGSKKKESETESK